MTSKEPFIHNLIEGKIAEIIFEMMFRETGKFTILRSGYESSLPELAQYQHEIKVKKVVDQIRSNPDFLLITEDKKQAYFVEVKFRSNVDQREILKIARDLSGRWPLCYLFIASISGFYFDPVHTIENNHGSIQRLEKSWVSDSIQEHFLLYIRKFLSKEVRKYT